MPIVPLVEKSVETKAMPAPIMGSSIRPNDGSGLTSLASAIENIVQKENDKAETVALLDTQKKLDDWEAQNLFNPQTGALAKKGRDAFNTPNILGGQYDKFVQDIEGTLSSDNQKLAFAKMALSRRDGILRTLYTHERSQMEEYAKQTAFSARDSAINRAALNFNNPDVVETSIKNAKDSMAEWGRVQGLPPEAIANQLIETESKARLAALSRFADNDPKAAIDYYKKHQINFSGEDLLQAQKLMAPTERKYKAVNVAKSVLGSASPKIDRDGVIEYVMNDLEGGDKVVTDSNGAVTKYGINQKWHPDLDVANLTPDQAKKRYADKYWDGIDADTLPPDMRLPAMSFAATSGSKEALRLIAQSLNDPRKFQELASDFYQGLARKDPEKYGPQLQGWMNRLAKVSAQIDFMHGQLPDEFSLNNRIDEMTDDVQVASDAKEIVNKQIESMRKSRKNAEDSASDEAWKFRQSGMEVPPSVIARMNPKTVAEMQKNAPTDPALYEDTRQKILSGLPVDLGSMRWRLGEKYAELYSLQNDPVKASHGRKVDEVIDSAGQILLGKSKPTTENDFKKIEVFRRQFDREIDNVQRQSGKVATSDDAQKIADRLLLTVSTNPGWLWDSGDKRMFELEPGEQGTVGGIPSAGTFLIQGKSFAQRDVLDVVIKNLRDKGMVVNDENIKKTYKKLLSIGQIKYTYDQVK